VEVGARGDSTAAELEPAPAGPHRRRITVLFADLSGFTALTQHHEPEDVRVLVDSFLVVAREAVERWGGRIDQFLGDGVLAVFGDPIAREDDAERAVRAAVDIRSATHDLRIAGSRGATPSTAHVGMATGMAVTADQSNSLGVTAPIGTVVNLAARLQTLAGEDEILLCGTTAQLVKHVSVLKPLGTRVLKGLHNPVEVHLVVHLQRSDPDVAGLSALVGRTSELAALAGAVETLVSERRGAAVVVFGEAGSGKSRLFHEIRRSGGAGGAPVTWLEGRGRSTRVSTPYAPIVEVISSMAGIDERHDERELRQRLARLVDELDLVGEDVIGTLHRLFAVEDRAEAERDREGYQVRLGHAVEALLSGAARRSPTVVCVQDLHWVDPSTITLLRSVVPALRQEVLFLLNSRPADDALIPDDALVIRLTDLDERAIGLLIESRLGGPAADALVALVAERSGGNALFAEEVLNQLVDEGRLESSDRGWMLRRDAVHEDVPHTVQGVIAARLDALPSAAGMQLRHAAVFGRDFTVDDLRGLEPGVEPTEALTALVRADLIRPVAGSLDAAGRYEFKHALTLDVVRSSLTKPERRRLHRAAAVSIESRMSGRIIEVADVLGAHYHLAGEVEPAVRHLGIAAQRALDRYAIDEADQLYGVAYRMLVEEAGDEERHRHLGSLLVGWVLVHYYRGTWRNATDLLARHDVDIEATNDARVRGMALAWRGFSAAIARASIGEALDLLDRAVGIGERADDAEVLAHAHTWRIWARFLGGQHVEALADGARVEALLDRLVDRRYVSIKSAGAVGLAQIGLGRFADARRTADWLIATGSATGSTRATSMGQSVLGLSATVTGDIEGSAAFARRAVATATDPIYRDFARVIGVHGLVAAGAVAEARSMHTDLVASCSALGLDGLILATSSAYAVLTVLDGDLTDGMAALDDAIDRAEHAGSRLLASFGRVYRSSIRTRAVTREVAVPLATVLRNPRFVTRHALPARRRAADELEQLLADLPAQGGEGLRWLVSVELAKLLAARGERPRAEAAIARAAGWMPDAPARSLDDLLGGIPPA
jgi:class 3 adenylate cyclase